jgi:outer membrane protein assembly factor BamD
MSCRSIGRRTGFASVYALLTVVMLFSSGCNRGFQPRNYANPEALFRGALQEFQRGRYANAIVGFERLTLDLASRDPLLTQTYYYLGLSHEKQQEFLLAAQAFSRLHDGFPGDTLAPVAMLSEGRAYQSLWRKPALDADYGLKALNVYRVLLTTHAASPEAVDATTRIATIEDWLARKDYDIGMHYLRTRKAYDSSIIYFKDVIETYPSTPTARKAWLAMLQAYQVRKWKEEADETCEEMRRRYPDDAEVTAACAVAGAGADSAGTVPPVLDGADVAGRNG